MAESPFIFEIDGHNYEQIVLHGSHQVPVLVDFWASWCQPCQILMPLLAKLVDEYGGRFVLAKINTEEQQAIAAQFGIRSIPTVKLFKNGAPVDEFMGALPEAQIRAFLDRHLPRESDALVTQAEQLLLSGDYRGAIATLDEARVADPDNPRIALVIAQAHAANGNLDAAELELERLPPDQQAEPDVKRFRARLTFDRIAAESDSPEVLDQRLRTNPNDSDARYRLAACQVVGNDIGDALDNLLLVMQRDRKYGDDAARLALLQIFDMLGDDPAVTRYRARMFNLLH
ncbi:MAG: thioredoxin [Gammaproteobacteria bacterium]|nr:thioredoxin [Gammaproteobacteria bacterium]